MTSSYVKCSTPFTSGPDLHMGHLRHFVIGDSYARWLRSQNEDVLFAIGFDCFGLPSELGAESYDMDPEDFVKWCAESMTEQLKKMNISLDYERSFLTSDPDIYHWSQYLFLLLLENDLIYRAKAEVDYCETCETTLAAMQVEDGNCWRCHNATVKKELDSWFLKVDMYAEEGNDYVTSLGTNTQSMMSSPAEGWDRKAWQSQRMAYETLGDFPISRQRDWGTPIPIVWCEKDGAVPVTFDELPVKLEESLERNCPKCGQVGVLEEDTLDSHFDAIWKWIPAAVPPQYRKDEMFCHEDLQKWLPVSKLIAGADVGGFIYNQRFLTKALRDMGPFEWLSQGEPFKSILLHEMILAEDGQKMSKHLGNTVDPMELIDEYGSDVVRVAILNAASPDKAIQWNKQPLRFAKRFLNQIKLYWEEHQGLTGEGSKELLRIRDQEVERIEWAYDRLQFNYVIKDCERLLKACRKHKGDPAVREVMETILTYMAPIAPELTEVLL